MFVRDKPCEEREKKQDWAEGAVKLQCRRHEAGRELWSKYYPTECLHQTTVVWSSSPLGLIHAVICGELFWKGRTSLRLTLKELTASGGLLTAFPTTGQQDLPRRGDREQRSTAPAIESNVNHKRIAMFPLVCCSCIDFLS